MRFLQTVAGLHQPARLKLSCCALAIACLAWCGDSQTAWASQATVTTLSLTSGGNVVSSVAGGTVVTLTATVQANGSSRTLGQINFCDATAGSCTDIHLLGTAQVTSAGTAILRLHPGPGSHSYKAVFPGALNDGASTSATIGLTVGPRMAGPQTTYTVASITGPVATNTYGTYALTANVGTKGTVPPSGTVSFSGTNVATGNGFSLPGTATLGPPSGSPGFLNVPIPKLNTGSADAPPLIAVADFNGDGFPDIVSAPLGGIAVSLGNGDGTFAAPLIPNVDPVDGINAFGVGDFNGDGISDLLVDDEDTGQLTVLLGKGDGTFTAGQSLPYPANSIAVADFNGDGKPDISLPGTTILLGNGDGTFTAVPNPPQISSSQLVAADFNGDGKIDLAASGGTGNTVTILLGNGDGTFTAVPSQTQLIASELVAADFNGDGKIDLATFDSVGGTLAVLLGNGDGTFTAPTTLPTDSNFSASSLAVGDFNGDGKSDVAVAVTANNSSTTPGAKVSIFPGNGDGTFGARSDVGFNVVTGAVDLTSLAAADLTGDGSSDLATFGSVFLGNLTITTATVNNVLPFGDSIIRADYPGDANNAPSSSTNGPAVLVPQQSFSLTSNPVKVTAGASASGSFSITSLNFAGTLNLSCSISVPQGQTSPPACSVQPTAFFFSPGGMDNLAYAVTTQATTLPGQYTATITATYAFGGVPPASTYATVTVAGQNYLLTNSGATIASPGASGNSIITISPTGGYTGQIAMSCSVSSGPPGAVNSPNCTIPSPISVTGPPVSTTLTLITQSATTPGPYTVTVTADSTGGLNATTSFTVNVPAPPPGFTMSGSAVTIASPGPSATSTITITPGGAFAGIVALSCAVAGGPTEGADAPTCSVTNPPAIVGAAAVTATLTVNTTAASTTANTHRAIRNQQPRGIAIAGYTIALASLLFFGFPIRQRRNLRQFGWLLITLLIGATMGCGGTKTTVPPADPGTTPGAYTVTITGSSGSIMATTSVTVTVN
jgi:trimeric autotransporter adhesin